MIDELEIPYMSFYASYAVIMELDRKKKSRRKIWTREWLLKENERGAYNGILNELRLTDKEDFRKYLRTSTFQVSQKAVTFLKVYMLRSACRFKISCIPVH